MAYRFTKVQMDMLDISSRRLYKSRKKVYVKNQCHECSTALYYKTLKCIYCGGKVKISIEKPFITKKNVIYRLNNNPN